MRIIDPGHKYEVNYLDGNDNIDTITFVKRGHPGKNHPGTTNQELLRVLIDRIKFLNTEIPWRGNEEILFYLRKALILHECRALERKIEKRQLFPEMIITDREDGHISLTFKIDT